MFEKEDIQEEFLEPITPKMSTVSYHRFEIEEQ